MNEYADVNGNARLHDKNGNLTRDAENDYVYDAFNRLVEVIRRSDGQTIALYAYDAKSRRVRREVTTGDAAIDETITYWYEGNRVIEEGDAVGTPRRQYVWGPDGLLQYQEDVFVDTFYVHENGYGNVALTTNQAVEAVFDRRDFNIYGVVEQNGVAAQLPYAFRAWRLDRETGFYLRSGCRYFAPPLGRTISRGVGFLLNHYAADGNAPRLYWQQVMIAAQPRSALGGSPGISAQAQGRGGGGGGLPFAFPKGANVPAARRAGWCTPLSIKVITSGAARHPRAAVAGWTPLGPSGASILGVYTLRGFVFEVEVKLAPGSNWLACDYQQWVKGYAASFVPLGQIRIGNPPPLTNSPHFYETQYTPGAPGVPSTIDTEGYQADPGSFLGTTPGTAGWAGSLALVGPNTVIWTDNPIRSGLVLGANAILQFKFLAISSDRRTQLSAYLTTVFAGWRTSGAVTKRHWTP